MRTFAYGARPPADRRERDWMNEQLRLAKRYRNALVASHRAEMERVSIAKRFGIDGAGGTERWIELCKAHYRESRRALRTSSGLTWGTYQLIEQDVERARSTGTPRFSRFDGSGRVGAAIQACSKLRTENFDVAKGEKRHRGSFLAVAALKMARGVTIHLPFVMHRPLPPGRLLRAYVQIDKIGTKLVWGLRVVVDEDAEKPKRRGVGKCAINFGWRIHHELKGVRIAFLVGDHGAEELIIPSEILEKIKHADHLKSLGDSAAAKYFGDARRRARMRAVGLVHPAPPVPDEWKPPWKNLRHWALQDRHLYEWECEERSEAIRMRRAITLKWVQHVASRYDQITIEGYSIADIIKREEKKVSLPHADHVRFVVAPGELRMLLKREVGSERIHVVRGAMTMPCAACGAKLAGDRVRSRELYCERCGAPVDQDANNAANQLSSTAAE